MVVVVVVVQHWSYEAHVTGVSSKKLRPVRSCVLTSFGRFERASRGHGPVPLGSLQVCAAKPAWPSGELSGLLERVGGISSRDNDDKRR